MPGSAIVRHVVTFGRVLREVGIEVGPGRVVDAVRGLGAVDVTRQEDVYFALRQTLVSRHDELELFDRAFVAWFLRGPVDAARAGEAAPEARRPDRGDARIRCGGVTMPRSSASRSSAARRGHELLREKDFAEMTAEEFVRARRLLLDIARAARGERHAGGFRIPAAIVSTCGG